MQAVGDRAVAARGFGQGGFAADLGVLGERPGGDGRVGREGRDRVDGRGGRLRDRLLRAAGGADGDRDRGGRGIAVGVADGVGGGGDAGGGGGAGELAGGGVEGRAVGDGREGVDERGVAARGGRERGGGAGDRGVGGIGAGAERAAAEGRVARRALRQAGDLPGAAAGAARSQRELVGVVGRAAAAGAAVAGIPLQIGLTHRSRAGPVLAVELAFGGRHGDDPDRAVRFLVLAEGAAADRHAGRAGLVADADLEGQDRLVPVGVGRLVGGGGAGVALGRMAGDRARSGVEADAQRRAGQGVGDRAVAAGRGRQRGFAADRLVVAVDAVEDRRRAEAGRGFGLDRDVERDAGRIAVGIRGGVGDRGGADRGGGAGEPAGAAAEAEAGRQLVVARGRVGALERVGDRPVAAAGRGQRRVAAAQRRVLDVEAVVGRRERGHRVGGGGDLEIDRDAVRVVGVGVGHRDLGRVGARGGGGAADPVARRGQARGQALDRVGQRAVAARGDAGDREAGDRGAGLGRDRRLDRAPARLGVRLDRAARPPVRRHAAGFEGAAEVAPRDGAGARGGADLGFREAVAGGGADPELQRVAAREVGQRVADRVGRGDAAVADLQRVGRAGAAGLPALVDPEGLGNGDAAQVGRGVGERGVGIVRVGRVGGAGDGAGGGVPAEPGGQIIVALGRVGAGQPVAARLDAARGRGQLEAGGGAGLEDALLVGRIGQGQRRHRRDREDREVGGGIAADADALVSRRAAGGHVDGGAVGVIRARTADLAGEAARARDVGDLHPRSDVVAAFLARAELEVDQAGLRGDDDFDVAAVPVQAIGREDVAVERVDVDEERAGDAGRAGDDAPGGEEAAGQALEVIGDRAVAAAGAVGEFIAQGQALAPARVRLRCTAPTQGLVVARSPVDAPNSARFAGPQGQQIDRARRAALRGERREPAAAPADRVALLAGVRRVSGQRDGAARVHPGQVAGLVIAAGAALVGGQIQAAGAFAPGHVDREGDRCGAVAVGDRVGDGGGRAGEIRDRRAAEHAGGRVEGDARRQAADAVGDRAAEPAGGRGQRRLGAERSARRELEGADAHPRERERLRDHDQAELELGRVRRAVAVGDDVLDRVGARHPGGRAEQPPVAAEPQPGGLPAAAQRVAQRPVAAARRGQRIAAERPPQRRALPRDRRVRREGGQLVGADRDVEREPRARRVPVGVRRGVGHRGRSRGRGRRARQLAVGGEVDAGRRAADRVADRLVAARRGRQRRTVPDDGAPLDVGLVADRGALREARRRVLAHRDQEGRAGRVAVRVGRGVGDRGRPARRGRGAGEHAGGRVDPDPGRRAGDRVRDRRIAAVGRGQRALVADRRALDEDLVRQSQVLGEARHAVGAALHRAADRERAQLVDRGRLGQRQLRRAVARTEVDRAAVAAAGRPVRAERAGAVRAPLDPAFAVGQVLGRNPAGAAAEQVVEAAALAQRERLVQRAGRVADAHVQRQRNAAPRRVGRLVGHRRRRVAAVGQRRGAADPARGCVEAHPARLVLQRVADRPVPALGPRQHLARDRGADGVDADAPADRPVGAEEGIGRARDRDLEGERIGVPVRVGHGVGDGLRGLAEHLADDAAARVEPQAGNPAQRVGVGRVAAGGGRQRGLAGGRDLGVLLEGLGRDGRARAGRAEARLRVLGHHDRERGRRPVPVRVGRRQGRAVRPGRARSAAEDAGRGVDRDPLRRARDRVAHRRVPARRRRQRDPARAPRPLAELDRVQHHPAREARLEILETVEAAGSRIRDVPVGDSGSGISVHCVGTDVAAPQQNLLVPTAAVPDPVSTAVHPQGDRAIRAAVMDGDPQIVGVVAAAIREIGAAAACGGVADLDLEGGGGGHAVGVGGLERDRLRAGAAVRGRSVGGAADRAGGRVERHPGGLVFERVGDRAAAAERLRQHLLRNRRPRVVGARAPGRPVGAEEGPAGLADRGGEAERGGIAVGVGRRVGHRLRSVPDRRAGDHAGAAEPDALGPAERVGDRRVAAGRRRQRGRGRDRRALGPALGRNRAAAEAGADVGRDGHVDVDPGGFAVAVGRRVEGVVGRGGVAGGAAEQAGGGIERHAGRLVGQRVGDRRVAAGRLRQRREAADPLARGERDRPVARIRERGRGVRRDHDVERDRVRVVVVVRHGVGHRRAAQSGRRARQPPRRRGEAHPRRQRAGRRHVGGLAERVADRPVDRIRGVLGQDQIARDDGAVHGERLIRPVGRAVGGGEGDVRIRAGHGDREVGGGRIGVGVLGPVDHLVHGGRGRGAAEPARIGVPFEPGRLPGRIRRAAPGDPVADRAVARRGRACRGEGERAHLGAALDRDRAER